MLTFAGDSDAHIVRGLIAILFAVFSGKPANDILDDRCAGAVRTTGLARASDAAAFQWLSLHGGTHPRRRARGANRRGGVTAI